MYDVLKDSLYHHEDSECNHDCHDCHDICKEAPDGSRHCHDFCYDGDIFIGRVISTCTHEIYRGQTTVTPLCEESTVLGTESKLVTKNITVLPIPYYEVDNISGTTVVIGG